VWPTVASPLSSQLVLIACILVHVLIMLLYFLHSTDEQYVLLVVATHKQFYQVAGEVIALYESTPSAIVTQLLISDGERTRQVTVTSVTVTSVTVSFVTVNVVTVNHVTGRSEKLLL
jgi:predicted permease